VAPAGAGKTLLLRSLTAALPEARYRVSYLKLTDLSLRDMCRQLAMALGAEPAGHFPALVQNLEEHIRGGFDAGVRPVILIDDAHEMRPEVMKLVRLITNFDMDSRLIVSLVLCGLPLLKQMLLRPELEDVRQRLVHCGELRLLSREETRAYVEHRAKIAGAQSAPFDAGASEAIFEITRGNMRAIDKLAQAALATCARASRGTVEAADVAAARASQWM
jgi:general secretion pathway protein A